MNNFLRLASATFTPVCQAPLITCNPQNPMHSMGGIFSFSLCSFIFFKTSQFVFGPSMANWAGPNLDLLCVWQLDTTHFCEKYPKLYFDAKHLQKGLKRGWWNFWCFFFFIFFIFFFIFFFRKVSFLANNGCCNNFVD